MTGMTPAWLTFSGMYVVAPPYIRRPIIRFAYWTGMRALRLLDEDHQADDRRRPRRSSPAISRIVRSVAQGRSAQNSRGSWPRSR